MKTSMIHKPQVDGCPYNVKCKACHKAKRCMALKPKTIQH